MSIPRFIPGQAIPCVLLDRIGWDVRGIWSLWTIAANAADYRRERALALFLHDDGRILQPTARHIWDVLLDQEPAPRSYLGNHDSHQIVANSLAVADKQGHSLYDEMTQFYADRLRREQGKKEYSFSTRRGAIEKIGLAAVRQHRLAELAHEEAGWKKEFALKHNLQPEIVLRLVVRVEGTGSNA
jgi:hypothetical protein